MKNGVPSEMYYALLDWKDKNLKEWREMKGNQRLCDLTVYELHKLNQALNL